MPSTDGIPARRAALQMLDSVLRRGQTLDSALGAAKDLADPDRALAVAIAGETLRRIPDLDALIDGATRQALPPDAKARMVLRLALAQKAGLGTPDHAVVATALPLVDGGPRRLVHGVLGTLLRRGLPPLDAPRLPQAVEQRWAAAWGEPEVLAARRQIAARPPLDLSFADDAAAQRFAAEQTGRQLAPRHVRLDGGGAVTNLAGFGEGGWWVQDLASSLPARLIPDDLADVLDLCAAPGGKTMQLAAAGHRVTALDQSRGRLDRLRANLARTGLEARLVQADARDWDADRQFDAVLLDAPCSATGTFRRHPEVLHRASAAVIVRSAEMQASLIRRAVPAVRPGGMLVYAVCSLEPEEGEAIVDAFLAEHGDFSAAPVDGALLPAGIAQSGPGRVRVLPGMLEDAGGLDGFFVARLVREGQ